MFGPDAFFCSHPVKQKLREWQNLIQVLLLKVVCGLGLVVGAYKAQSKAAGASQGRMFDSKSQAEHKAAKYFEFVKQQTKMLLENHNAFDLIVTNRAD